MGTLAKNEGPDEMPHNATFHQGLHYLLRLKRSSEKEFQLESITCNSSIYTMNHPMFIVSYRVEEPIRIQRVKEHRKNISGSFIGK